MTDCNQMRTKPSSQFTYILLTQVAYSNPNDQILKRPRKLYSSLESRGPLRKKIKNKKSACNFKCDNQFFFSFATMSKHCISVQTKSYQTKDPLGL